MLNPLLRQPPDLGNLLRRPRLPNESATVSDPKGFLRHADFVRIEFQAFPKEIVSAFGVQARGRIMDLIAHGIPPQWFSGNTNDC